MEKLQLEYYKNIAIITKGNGFNENTTNGNNNRTFILLGTVDTILSSPIFEGLRRKSKNPYNLQALKSQAPVDRKLSGSSASARHGTFNF